MNVDGSFGFDRPRSYHNGLWWMFQLSGDVVALAGARESSDTDALHDVPIRTNKLHAYILNNEPALIAVERSQRPVERGHSVFCGRIYVDDAHIDIW